MAHWEFPATGPIDLHISLISGKISIAAEPTEVITVSLTAIESGKSGDSDLSDVQVDYVGGRLAITESRHFGIRRRGAELDLGITLPEGSRCSVRTSASSVSCQGELGSLDVRTANGDVLAAVVRGPVQVNTFSGNVRVDAAHADVSAHTASGDIWLQRADGDVTADTASGDVHVGTAMASVFARTASGNVRIASIATGQADLTCVSGDIWVGVLPGADVYLDLASVIGRVSSELAPGGQECHADLNLKCRTVNGDVRVSRVALVSDSG